MESKRTYPLPYKPEIVDITPDMASDWLATRVFEGNRKPAKAKIEQHSAAMKAGQWLEAHRQWPEIENWTMAVYGARSVASIPPSPLLAIVSMGERGGVHPSIITDFLGGLKSGAIGDAHDTRLILRNRFIRDRKSLGGSRNRPHAYALLVKGFNAYVKGERPSRLLYTEGDHIPLPYGITWNGEPLIPRSEAA